MHRKLARVFVAALAAVATLTPVLPGPAQARPGARAAVADPYSWRNV